MNLQFAEESEFMPSGGHAVVAPKGALWFGCIVSAIPALLLLFGGILNSRTTLG